MIHCNSQQLFAGGNLSRAMKSVFMSRIDYKIWPESHVSNFRHAVSLHRNHHHAVGKFQLVRMFHLAMKWAENPVGERFLVQQLELFLEQIEVCFPMKMVSKLFQFVCSENVASTSDWMTLVLLSWASSSASMHQMKSESTFSSNELFS